MMKMKRIISLALTLCLMAGLGSALALDAGEERVVIGANISDAQIDSVYKTFGVDRGSVKELKVTNAEERQYLAGLVSESIIGTNSISCVYIKTLDANSGLLVETSNTTWCGRDMYVNALVTAGIDDAHVIVTAPVAVSGTAALTGIYKAYEDITGQELDPDAKEVGTQELITTAEIAEQIGEADTAELVNELKKMIEELKDMTDEQVRTEINNIAINLNISLTQDQVEELLKLCRSFEKLDTAALADKVDSLKNFVTSDAATGFLSGVKNFFVSIGNFLSNLFKKN